MLNEGQKNMNIASLVINGAASAGLLTALIIKTVREQGLADTELFRFKAPKTSMELLEAAAKAMMMLGVVIAVVASIMVLV